MSLNKLEQFSRRLLTFLNARRVCEYSYDKIFFKPAIGAEIKDHSNARYPS